MVLNRKLIVCIDGFGYDLISKEDTPFLYENKENGKLNRLETLFAFTGIEYNFFTGKTPEESKIWLEFSRTNSSIFRNYLIKFFSFNRKLKDYMGIILQLLSGRTYLCSLHNIPNKKIKYFDSSVAYGLWKLPFFQRKSFAFYKWPFFIIKREKEKRKIIFRYETDNERIKRLTKDKDLEIYYTQLMEVDKAIHKYGKKSERTKKILKKTDKLLEETSKRFIEENKNSEIIIWSDHGFADIKNYINLEMFLPKRKDYLYFIAGTTVSFWFKNDEVKKEIEKILSSLKQVKKLTNKEYKKYEIPASKQYGELVYFVNKGNYFFPNFYQKNIKERFNAMHGYPDDSELDGFILFENNGKKVNKNLKMKDIFGSLQ